MKILLQDKLTKDYLTINGRTNDIRKAHDFLEVPSAGKLVMTKRLAEVRLVLDMSDQFGHERWNSRFEIRINGESHLKAEGENFKRRVVYPEQQTGLPQNQ